MAESLTDEKFQELQQKYPRLARVSTPAGEVVFRAPTMPEENAFQAAMFGSMGHAGMAWRNLMQTLVVYPDQATFAQWVQQWPAMNLNNTILRALKVLRGEVNEDEVK